MTKIERIPTNLRTLLILELFAKNNRAMSATDVHGEIDLPPQTVHRLLVSLEKEGLNKDLEKLQNQFDNASEDIRLRFRLKIKN